MTKLVTAGSSDSAPRPRSSPPGSVDEGGQEVSRVRDREDEHGVRTDSAAERVAAGNYPPRTWAAAAEAGITAST
jgi:hypothetical protein